LIVPDERGRERIVIASPLPNPVVNGKTVKRRTGISAGIQFKDANGVERGGIAAEDDGSFMFGIDDERGQERAHFYYIPKRGSGVYLQGEDGKQIVSLLLPRKGSGDAKLEMTNEDGRLMGSFPSQK
jgi:hypothetical protein